MPTSSGSTASTAAYSTERLGRARARATKKGRSFLRPFSCPGRRQRSVQLGLDVADRAFDLRRGGRPLQLLGSTWPAAAIAPSTDRKSVVQGQRLSGSVDLGGRRINKKTNTIQH